VVYLPVVGLLVAVRSEARQPSCCHIYVDVLSQAAFAGLPVRLQSRHLWLQG
jgi:hypothetical protein